MKSKSKEDILKETKMVDDEDTAYDEVIKEINDLKFTFVEDKEGRERITQKLKQLMRLLDDDDSEIFGERGESK